MSDVSDRLTRLEVLVEQLQSTVNEVKQACKERLEKCSKAIEKIGNEDYHTLFKQIKAQNQAQNRISRRDWLKIAVLQSITAIIVALIARF